jgi:hypothetical protein
MYGLLTGATMVALLVDVFLIRGISGTTPVPGPAPRTASAPAASSTSSSRSTGLTMSPRRKASPSPSTSPVSGSEVTDAASGLSYRLLPSPWSPGCPYQLNTSLFSWSAGESALAGEVAIGGNNTLWYGDACSGQFQQQFQYSGTADLEPAAMSLADELEVAHSSGLCITARSRAARRCRSAVTRPGWSRS